jgi:translation initiation factor 1
MPKDPRPTVYSTASGDQRKRQKNIPLSPSLAPEKHLVYLHRESKGRGGKTVTLVKELHLNQNDLKKLATALKNACGTGGTIKDGIIEIQGDHREKIAGVLGKLGYKSKIAGG